MIYLKLFLGFLWVGCFSFGGAYSAIPLIRDTVMSMGWLNDEELAHMIAVSESTPGPIMVNLATYVGSSQGGVLGAIIATFAVVLPAFLIILLVVTLLKKVLESPAVNAAIGGIVPCVVGVIGATGLVMLAKNLVDFGTWTVDLRAIILAVVLGAVFFGCKPVLKKKMSPILLIAIAAVLGAVVYSI